MAPLPMEISSALSASLTAQTKLVHSPPAYGKALSKSLSRGLPAIAISPAQGQQLAILCKMINAKRVLEIGTLGGYSTLWFAGSSDDVKVTSIEIDPKHRDVALENVKAAGKDVEERVEIILGAALDILPQLAEKEGESGFDFVFIDADWENQKTYFEWAVKLTRKGGCVYVDNAVRQITESEAEGDSEGATALIEAVAKTDRVAATLIPTLNTHKETLEGGIADGYLLATVL